MKEKVILAYSGGLDTTAIIPWLKENFDYEVVCVCIDCGQEEELNGLEERAKLSGASKLYIEDIVDDENIQETIVEEDESSENQQIDTVEDDTDEDINQEEAENIETSSEDLPGSESDEESIQDQKEQEKILENVAEVKEIVDKNPRITLWSSQSAAVFRYLRKTEPEFSISKEASVLIDEAVSKKYPEIWELFEDI